jgi:hypothetical protein
VAELTVKLAFPPLKPTAVAPRKLLPVSTTLVPAVPLFGANPEILGKGVKDELLVAEPAGFVTVIGPIVALDGTWAVI